MRFPSLASLLTTLMLTAGCGSALSPEQGGANANDRSLGGNDGEQLLTGAMVVSPDGAHVVMQRNTVTVLVDVASRTATELPFQGDRFVFSKTRHVLYVVKQRRAGIVALDLDRGGELWSVTPAFRTTAGALLFRISDDDRSLLVGDYDRAFVLDPRDGDIRGTIKIGSTPTDAAFLGDEALVVGTVRWADHKPSTTLVRANLTSLASRSIEVPNCDAPLAVLPDGSRALLSPTFCEEGQAQRPSGQWTNPDPVSVIDLGPDLRFVKNLPGFGPVALARDGTRAVAYLDTKRMDPSMFDDRSQVPSAVGDQYHLMIIDPRTTGFSLTPVGSALPRFAMTLDGRGLLVDSTVSAIRGGAYADVTIGPDGITASARLFGTATTPVGYFDLDSKTYTPVSGPAAPLDRFVQTQGRVYTLKTRADGMGGDLFSIDLGARTATGLGQSLRDIGILPDGTLILRVRLPAVSRGGSMYASEEYCFTKTVGTCDFKIRYESKTPVVTCSHDCT